MIVEMERAIHKRDTIALKLEPKAGQEISDWCDWLGMKEGIRRGVKRAGMA